MLNQIKTSILMVALTLLLVFVGGMVGGRIGMILAFLFAALMNFFSYWYSDKIVLAMYGAKPASKTDMPELYSIVSRLTLKAGLPMPKLYVLPQKQPNAFATGRNPKHAAVAVTSGIMEILNEDELAGVLAHELSHVKNRDILVSTVVATIAGAIMILASIARWTAIFGGFGSRNDREGGGGNVIGLIVAAVVAPIAATLIQLAISRSREYMADRSGAKITHNPRSLASALRKLEQSSKIREATPLNRATAHLFIVNPFKGEMLMNLFSTHPPIGERIKRLENMMV